MLSYPVFEVGAAHAGTLLPEVVPRVCDAAGIESVVRAVVSGLPLPPAYAERHSRVSCPWLERLAYAAAPTSEWTVREADGAPVVSWGGEGFPLRTLSGWDARDEPLSFSRSPTARYGCRVRNLILSYPVVVYRVRSEDQLRAALAIASAAGS